MLQCYIEILADVRLLAHHTQQVPWEMRGISIVQTNPFNTRDISHLLYQFRNMLLTVNIDTIIGQLLRNDIKLLDALSDQIAHLIQNLLHRTTLMLARNQRYSTIGAMAVATF